MNNAIAIATVLGPFYMILGLSILLYAKTWQVLLEKWEKDHLSLIGLMVFSVVGGLLIISLYNVWTWNVWIIVTIAGWSMLIKGAFYFLAPGAWIKSVIELKRSKALLYVGGVCAVLLGAVLIYYVYFV